MGTEIGTEPLTAEEEAELRADFAIHGPFVYGEDVARLLATLAARSSTPLDDGPTCVFCSDEEQAGPCFGGKRCMKSHESAVPAPLDDGGLDAERIAAAHLFAMANGWFDDVIVEELFDESGQTPEDRWRRYSNAVASRIFEADPYVRRALAETLRNRG